MIWVRAGSQQLVAGWAVEAILGPETWLGEVGDGGRVTSLDLLLLLSFQCCFILEGLVGWLVYRGRWQPSLD